MPKNPASSVVHEPLVAILGTRTKLAVLRALSGASHHLPLREIARRSGMAYRGIELAIRELLEVGLLEELPGGRERRIRLRSGHRLTPALTAVLRAEADFFPALRAELRAIGVSGEGKDLMTVALVGAVARRTERIGDRVELVVIGNDQAGADKWRKQYEVATEGIEARYGVRCRVIVYDLDMARRMYQTRTAATDRMVLEAESVLGVPLKDLLS